MTKRNLTTPDNHDNPSTFWDLITTILIAPYALLIMVSVAVFVGIPVMLYMLVSDMSRGVPVDPGNEGTDL